QTNAPTPLPSPSGISHWLLEAPIPLMLLILLAGIVAYVLLSKRVKRRAAMLTLFLAGILAGAVFAIARTIKTDREQLMARTTDLVDAVAAGDPAKLDPLLRSDAREATFNFSRDTILARVGADMKGQYALKTHSVSD